MLTIMNQTKLAATFAQPVVEVRELSFDELDAVAGGGFLHYLVEVAHALVQPVPDDGQGGGVVGG